MGFLWKTILNKGYTVSNSSSDWLFAWCKLEIKNIPSIDIEITKKSSENSSLPCKDMNNLRNMLNNQRK